MSTFKQIREEGNIGRHHDDNARQRIVCRNGENIVVLAGQQTPCYPSVSPCDTGSCVNQHPFYDKPCNYSGPYERFFVPETSTVPKNFSKWMPFTEAPADVKGPFFGVPGELIQEYLDDNEGEIA